MKQGEDFNGVSGDADDNRRGIRSIEVGGKLLAALVSHGAPMSLKDLAAAAGMASAKAHPYLVSFSKIGLISQDAASGQYELGPFALQMGLISLQLLDPIKIAVPEIARLAEQINQTVGLAVWGTGGPTIVYRVRSSYPIHVTFNTGSVMSMTRTATGLLFAAYLPWGRVAGTIERDLAGLPAAERLSPRELEAVLAETRAQGLARADGLPVAGMNSLSAPVFDHSGALVLSLTASGLAGTFDTALDGPIARAIKASAAEISSRLGFRA